MQKKWNKEIILGWCFFLALGINCGFYLLGDKLGFPAMYGSYVLPISLVICALCGTGFLVYGQKLATKQADKPANDEKEHELKEEVKDTQVVEIQEQPTETSNNA